MEGANTYLNIYLMEGANTYLNIYLMEGANTYLQHQPIGLKCCTQVTPPCLYI